jgi:N-acetylglucosamine malate deacetylase 1
LIPLRRDRSTDHDATFKLVSHSLSRVPIKARVLEYPIWSWRDPLALVTPALLAKETWTVDIMAVHHRKRRAIEAYRSQVEPVPPDSHPILSSAFLGNFLESEEFFFER